MARSAITSRQSLNYQQNLLIQSEDFSNVAWTAQNILTPSLVSIPGPLGPNVNASLITEDTNTGLHRCYQQPGFGTFQKSGNYYSYSCYFKAGTQTYFALYTDLGTGTPLVRFNLNNGTVASTTSTANVASVSGTIQAFLNGWYRCTLIVQMSSSLSTAFLSVGLADSSSASYTGSSKTGYFWGAQAVQANWAGDYTVTTSSTVTNPIRNQINSRTAATNPIDPRNVPQLMAGGIWLPSLGVTDIGGGDHTWDSQATQANQLTTVNNFDKAVLTTSSNGVTVWDYPKTVYGSGFLMTATGSALRFATKGSYAGWFKANALDENLHFFFDCWPQDGVNNRMFAYKNNSSDGNGASTKMSLNGSPLGIGDDVSLDRWKYNNTEGIQDWTKWTFIRITYDYSLDNYTHDGGNFSRKCKVYFNEVLDEGAGYSAPPPPTSSPPGGPVIGSGLYSGVQRFCVGCSFATGTWEGQVGPIYIANGEVSDSVWAKIMNYNAPA